MALFVVDAVAGPQVMTTKLWREAEGMRLSRAVFINHIDRENADFDTAMALLHARFGSRLGPVTIPMGVDEDFKGVIDILRMKARYFDQGDANAERVEDIPAEYADVAQAARDKLCDLVAEADDELMMKYLEGDEQLTQEELESLLDKAITQELFIPVFVGSTIIEQGIQGGHGRHRHLLPHARAHHGTLPSRRRRRHVNIDESGASRRVRVQDAVRSVRGSLELREGVLGRARARAWSSSTRARARRSAWDTCT